MKKSKGKTLKLIFSSLSVLLFLFLIIKWFMFTAEWFPKLHFCNYLMNIIFSFVFLGFTIIFILLLFRKKKISKIWLIIYAIVIIIGIILMNIVVCDSTGKMSFGIQEMLTTYPEVATDVCKTTCEGWDFGHMNKLTARIEDGEKVEFGCLEVGDLFVDETEMLIKEVSSVYNEADKVYCCCYNIDTCEEFGYISRTPEEDFTRYEEVEVGKLICWKEKTIPEPTFICCEMFNLDKEGKKTDINYGWMTRDECSEMQDFYDGTNVVDGSLCEK